MFSCFFIAIFIRTTGGTQSETHFLTGSFLTIRFTETAGELVGCGHILVIVENFLRV